MSPGGVAERSGVGSNIPRGNLIKETAALCCVPFRVQLSSASGGVSGCQRDSGDFWSRQGKGARKGIYL